MFLVDRHQLSREAMRALLERDPRLQVVGEAETAAEVIGQTSAARPDILVAACHIEADRHGVMVSALHRACPEIPLLVLTPPTCGEAPAEAFAAGADGLVFTDVSSEVVVKAIDTVCAGEMWAQRSDLRETVRQMRAAGEPAEPGPGLTHRESEVLQLLAEGMTTREIARSLYISNSTARVHTSRLLGKLGAHNRVQAVRMALEKGMVG